MFSFILIVIFIYFVVIKFDNYNNLSKKYNSEEEYKQSDNFISCEIISTIEHNNIEKNYQLEKKMAPVKIFMPEVISNITNKDDLIYTDITYNSNEEIKEGYKLLWKKIRPLISCNNRFILKNDKLLSLTVINENQHLFINNIFKFYIYSDKNNPTNIIANSSMTKKRTVQQSLEPYIVTVQDHSINNISFTLFKGTNIIKRISCREEIKDPKGQIIIEMLNENFDKIIIPNVLAFNIYEITPHKTINTIFSYSTYKNAPKSPLSDFYIIIEHREGLLLYKNFQLLHSIKSVFYFHRKICIDGSLICQQHYKENEDNYVMKLLPNGEIDYIKVEGITDYPHVGKYKLVDENDYVNIYFFYNESLSFHIVDEYTKNADYKEIIPNKFEDDVSTINYHVKYKKDRYADIFFIFKTLDCRGNWVFNTFNSGLYGLPLKKELCSGNAIYNIPYIDYYKGLEGDYKYINTISQSWLTEEQRNNFKMYVEKVYYNYNLPVNYDCLPEKFTEGLISSDSVLEELESYIKYLSNNNIVQIDYRNNIVYDNNQCIILDYKAKKQEIISTITLNGKYNKKWKSEVELYSLVAKYFPDAIYQYRSKILERQSFDVFIPSLNVAIEYQGIQHYETVDLFGGHEGLQKRILLDKHKRQICEKNNIILIEWKYDIPVNKLNLEKKLKQINKYQALEEKFHDDEE